MLGLIGVVLADRTNVGEVTEVGKRGFSVERNLVPGHRYLNYSIRSTATKILID